jgi:3-oxoacyl-[acyl-carrier protein] reductase
METASMIRDEGGHALAVTTDVRDWDSVKNMCDQTVEIFSGLDIVVINAGAICKPVPAEDIELKDWQNLIDINLTGAFYCARAAIPHLKKSSAGKIIIFGSGAGHRMMSGTSVAYACSKAGAWMLTRGLAKELAPFNICVNEIIPGFVKTDMTRELISHTGDGTVPEIDVEWHKEPEDVVPLALFLATQPDKGPTAQSFSLMRREK